MVRRNTRQKFSPEDSPSPPVWLSRQRDSLLRPGSQALFQFCLTGLPLRPRAWIRYRSFRGLVLCLPCVSCFSTITLSLVGRGDYAVFRSSQKGLEGFIIAFVYSILLLLFSTVSTKVLGNLLLRPFSFHNHIRSRIIDFYNP